MTPITTPPADLDAMMALPFGEWAREHPNGRVTLYAKLPLTASLGELLQVLYWTKGHAGRLIEILNEGNSDFTESFRCYVKSDYVRQFCDAVCKCGGTVTSYECHG